jgi:hypothetical protein
MEVYRVSNLEAFRQWRMDEDAELADLLPRLEWDGEANEAMRAGTAFHKGLELATTGTTLDRIEQNGYRFVFADDFEMELPEVRELRSSKTYIIDGEPIIISGQVDAIKGNVIIDHKTTSRFDPDIYLAGYSWRLYLAIFGADLFRWNVFEMSEEAPKLYEVHKLHQLTQYRYPNMEQDCEHLIEDFARFTRAYLTSHAAAHA